LRLINLLKTAQLTIKLFLWPHLLSALRYILRNFFALQQLVTIKYDHNLICFMLNESLIKLSHSNEALFVYADFRFKQQSS